tara:strand:- start:1196 stop:1882 length:687 start_codon:yes stop_codon:yes gene_type:complete
MDQPFSKNELKAKVKKNPASPFFLILTQLLIDENDLKNASMVCNSGLEHHPESIEGNFLLAKILFREEHFSEAEKRLKFVINRHGAHINGYKLLGKIQRSLNRSPNTIKSTIDKILELNEEDSTALNWLQEIYLQEKPNNGNVQTTDPKEDKNNLTGMEEEWQKIIPISMRMATLTLAEVYKTQGYYLQAKEVLKMVERKGGDRWRIRKMRSQLDKLIQQRKTEQAEA